MNAAVNEKVEASLIVFSLSERRTSTGEIYGALVKG